MNKKLTQHHQTFESLKQTDDEEAEFWYARELQNVLDYSRWEKFKQVIKKAITACKQSEQPTDDHFHQVVKMVQISSREQNRRVGTFSVPTRTSSTSAWAKKHAHPTPTTREKRNEKLYSGVRL